MITDYVYYVDENTVIVINHENEDADVKLLKQIMKWKRYYLL